MSLGLRASIQGLVCAVDLRVFRVAVGLPDSHQGIRGSFIHYHRVLIARVPQGLGPDTILHYTTVHWTMLHYIILYRKSYT